MKITVLICIITSMVGLTSCFEKEEAMSPGQWTGQAFAFDESIYDQQFFYSLNSNTVVSKNRNVAWDLAFESAKQGWHIRINSANLLGIWRTGTTNFDLTSFPLIGGNWLYDKSDGDPDSTAIGKWVDITAKVYTSQVYLTGTYDGVTYRPSKKIAFTDVTDTSYTMKYADMNGSNFHEVVIKKDTSYNQVYYSFSNNQQIAIEPERDSWDLLFTQYTTTLYTSEGVAVPYFVRGTLINPHKVEALLDSIHDFSYISLASVGSTAFNKKWDIIGHNWKAVEIDEQANSAKYKVREKYSYVIRSVNGEAYKLKFTSFFNENRTPGYPSFIFIKLQ